MSQSAAIDSSEIDQTPEQLVRVRLLMSPLHILRREVIELTLEERLKASVRQHATFKAGDPRGPS